MITALAILAAFGAFMIAFPVLAFVVLMLTPARWWGLDDEGPAVEFKPAHEVTARFLVGFVLLLGALAL